MNYIVKRRFDSKLTTGIVGVILCFVYAMIYWPVWATVAKIIISFTAAAGLQAVEPALAKKIIATFAGNLFLVQHLRLDLADFNIR